MGPSLVAKRLRTIASKIDKSSRPDRTLVARDLKRVIAGLQIAEAPEIPPEVQKIVDAFFKEQADTGESFSIGHLEEALSSLGDIKIEIGDYESLEPGNQGKIFNIYNLIPDGFQLEQHKYDDWYVDRIDPVG